MIWSQRGFRQDSSDRRAVNRTSAKNEDYLRYQWNECWKCYPNYSHLLACIKRNVFSSSPESVKIFLKKHLFAERRTTVCYSNYRVADCKVFLISSPGGWQKGIGLFLLVSDWPKRWACCCYCGGKRVKVTFLEVVEGSKITSSFLGNPSEGEDVLEMGRAEV